MSVTVSEKNITQEIASGIEKNLAANSSDGALRKEALEAFRALGLPANKSEEYKFTPITRALEKNFEFSGQNAIVKEFDITL